MKLTFLCLYFLNVKIAFGQSPIDTITMYKEISSVLNAVADERRIKVYSIPCKWDAIGIYPRFDLSYKDEFVDLDTIFNDGLKWRFDDSTFSQFEWNQNELRNINVLKPFKCKLLSKFHHNYNLFSIPLFSKDLNYALIYNIRVSRGIAKSGYIYILKKTNDRWIKLTFYLDWT